MITHKGGLRHAAQPTAYAFQDVVTKEFEPASPELLAPRCKQEDRTSTSCSEIELLTHCLIHEHLINMRDCTAEYAKWMNSNYAACLKYELYLGDL